VALSERDAGAAVCVPMGWAHVDLGVIDWTQPRGGFRALPSRGCVGRGVAVGHVQAARGPRRE
jgi:hypothetical protein